MRAIHKKKNYTLKVQSSYNTHPNAHTSDLYVYGLFSHTSGLLIFIKHLIPHIIRCANNR